MKRARVLIALFATVSLSTLALSLTVHASTAVGSTPAEETTCDTATGVAFGLCNAYCEATDCDDGTVTFADDSGCNALEDASWDLTADTLTCGSSTPESTCSSKGYEQAERRYMTCFTTKRIIKKEFTTYNETLKTYELTDAGRKLVGDGKIRECIGDRCFTDHDCETNVKTWLGTCLSRCGTGDGITRR